VFTLPVDLHKLAIDVLAACQGDAAALEAVRSKLGGPDAITVERLRAQVLQRAGTLRFDDVHRYLTSRFGTSLYRIYPARKALIPSPLIEETDWDILFDAMSDHAIERLQGGERMTDAALHRLAERNADVPVTALDISGWHGRLTDSGLAAFQKMPQLRDVQLCWQQNITGNGIAALAACEQIEIVNLMGTNCGDDVLRSLSGKKQLRKLSLGRGTTNAGIPLLHELPRFKTWHRDLDVRYGLMDFDVDPTYLLLDGEGLTDKGLDGLQGLDGLFGLNLFWHCSNLSGKVFSRLDGLANLGFLGADGKLCTDAAFESIAALPQLKMLMGQGAVATPAGFEKLSRSRTLQFIWGRDCEGFDNQALRALSQMPALRGFAISCKNVDDATLAGLKDFPALTQLMPMDVSDAGFWHVGQCANLEALWCMYCRETGDAATEHIAGLRKLKRYYAGKTRITDRSLQTLSQIPSLEQIELWGCDGLTDTGVAKLSALPALQKITVHDSPQVTSAIETMFPPGVIVDYLRR
jgi:hypothetical protein